MIGEIERLQAAEQKILADPIIRRVVEMAQQEGVGLYLVGGAVRDFLLGREPRDYDFVMERLHPPFLDRLGIAFEASYFSMGKGREERVYRLVKGDKILDFTVMTGRNVQEDLMRRDFTINAIAYSFSEKKFYAPARALEDMERRRIDLLSSEAIIQDPLRMLRALRYVSTLGFELTPRLKEEVLRSKELLGKVAPERIRSELDVILLSDDPAGGLEPMLELGLLHQIFPEMASLEGVEQGEPHTQDVLRHTVAVTARAMKLAVRNPYDLELDKEMRLVLGYAALFHDLGKPETRQVDEEGKVHFYGHPQVSAEKASRIMRRYRFPTSLREKVLKVVSNHMRPLTLLSSSPRDAALRRLINAVGEATPALLLLGLAEVEAKEGSEGERDAYLELSRRILSLMRQEEVISPPKLIGGRDLMEMGYSPGPRMGEILEAVRQRQIEGLIRTRQEALEFVKRNFPPRGERREA